MNFDPPKGLETREARKELAERLTVMYRAWETSSERFRPRWEQIEDAYRGRLVPSLKKPWAEAPEYNVSVVAPRVDQSTAMVCGPQTKATPLFLARIGGPSSPRIDDLEANVHYLLNRAQYLRRLRMLVTLAQKRGKSIAKMSWEKDRSGEYGPTMTPIDLADFVHYPSYALDIPEMSLVGHRLAMREADIAREQQDGNFFEDCVILGPTEIRRGVDDRQWRSSGAGTGDINSSAPYPQDEGVQVVEFWWRGDPDDSGKERWIFGTFCPAYMELLHAVEVGGYRRPWYFEVFLHQEYDYFIPSNCRAFDLLAPQFMTNDFFSMATWGTMYGMLPTLWGNSFALPDDITVAPPGGFIPVDTMGPVGTNNIRFDPGMMEPLMAAVRQNLDDVSRIGGNALGGTLRPGATTATEAQASYAGSLTGLSEDATNLGFGLCQMVDFLVGDLLYAHYSEFKAGYSEALTVMERSAYRKPYWYEVNGQTPTNTPTALQQQASAIMATFGQLALIPGFLQQIAGIQPDFAVNMLRTIIMSSELPGKDTILPTKEETPDLTGTIAQPGQTALPGGQENSSQGALGLQGMAGLNGNAGPMAGAMGTAPGPNGPGGATNPPGSNGGAI